MVCWIEPIVLYIENLGYVQSAGYLCRGVKECYVPTFLNLENKVTQYVARGVMYE